MQLWQCCCNGSLSKSLTLGLWQPHHSQVNCNCFSTSHVSAITCPATYKSPCNPHTANRETPGMDVQRPCLETPWPTRRSDWPGTIEGVVLRYSESLCLQDGCSDEQSTL